MSLDEIKENIGKEVMTTDAGNKLIPSGRMHGPYKLLQLTKSGRVILEGYEHRPTPSNIHSYVATAVA